GQAAKEIRVFFNTTVGNKGPCIRVERGVIHEKYLSPYKGYDIALLKLEQALPKFNRFVRPICLPRKYERTDEGPMLLAGYGTTNFKNKVPRHIMYYFTNALTEEKCDKALVKHWPSLRLSSSKVLCSWNPHQLAWMVQVVTISLRGKVSYCGGSILNRNVILTAAHCVMNRSMFDNWKILVHYNTTNLFRGPMIEVKRGIVHKRFERAVKGYDIALLEVRHITSTVTGVSSKK
ncbi:hypothetical protein V5799_013878, partial [Amblyomma americanum]